MRVNLKALGLALLAAFAMSAVVASAAQATTAKFTAAAYPAVATGNQEGGATNQTNFFEATAGQGKTECHVASYQMTLTEAQTSITVTPHYAQCSSSGFTNHVDLNGCHFLFKVGAIVSETDVHGTADVVCPVGQSITLRVTVFGTTACTTHIPAQTGLTGITYTNVANGDVTVDVDIKNQITYTETRDNGFCPFNTHVQTHDGDFVSKVLVEGFNDTGNEVTGAGTTTPGVTHYKHNLTRNIDVKTSL